MVASVDNEWRKHHAGGVCVLTTASNHSGESIGSDLQKKELLQSIKKGLLKIWNRSLSLMQDEIRVMRVGILR